MKITNYINMKSAYEALEAVRGRMPSTETAKSWVVEPIKSAWSKPTGKAVFIAVGAMATLAIALIAFKSINKPMQKKVECDQSIQNKDVQQADEGALQRKYRDYSFQELQKAHGELEASTEKEFVSKAIDARLVFLTKMNYCKSSLEDLNKALTANHGYSGRNKVIVSTLKEMIKEKQALAK